RLQAKIAEGQLGAAPRFATAPAPLLLSVFNFLGHQHGWIPSCSLLRPRRPMAQRSPAWEPAAASPAQARACPALRPQAQRPAALRRRRRERAVAAGRLAAPALGLSPEAGPALHPAEAPGALPAAAPAREILAPLCALWS